MGSWGKTRVRLERLDHGAIFILIAGTLTAVHGILFQGWLRWVPIVLVWAAAITGSFVALVEALRHMKKQGAFIELPLLDFVAATSVGKVGGEILLDLNYEEDSKAEVDMNIVKTGGGQFVEIQGTAEDTPFSGEELAALMAAADKGIQELIAIQRKVVGEVALKKPRPKG